MGVQNEWLKKLGLDESIWAFDNSDVFPSVFNAEYRYLRELAMQGQIYGVMLQAKDIYETLIKLPVIMALIILENEADPDSSVYLEVMGKALAEPLSMGSWDNLAASIIKKTRKNETSLPVSLITILEKTRKLLAAKISDQHVNAVNWRNETIGHGALRFQDNPAFQNELIQILQNFKNYFSGNQKYSVNRLYENLYLVSGERKLNGFELETDDSSESLFLYAEGRQYTDTHYIIQNELKCFFFESYYERRKICKYSTYYGGGEISVKDQYFQDLLLAETNVPLTGKLIRRDEDRLLECIYETKDYIEPEALIETLQQRMDALDRGIITVHMERGTGKSAFASRMNGLYYDEPLIEDVFCRSYHISHAGIRGVSDFVNTLNISFQRSYNPAEDLSGSSERLAVLPHTTDQPETDMAEFLNCYHEIYDCDKTILIIDGIDELSRESEKILDYIPSSKLLNPGVFIILLSRFEDEKTLIGQSSRYVQAADRKSDSVIELRRQEPENILLLKKYIDQYIPECDYADELIAKADYRFLYLKPYVLLDRSISLETENETMFVESYLEYLLSLYADSQKAKLKEMAVTVALFPEISLKEYQEYLNCPELTYSFIGILNDLMPLMTKKRTDGEDRYEYADTQYREFILDRYSDEMPGIIHVFGQNLEDYLNRKVKPTPEDKLLEAIFGRKVNIADEETLFYARYIPVVNRILDQKHEFYMNPEPVIGFIKYLASQRYDSSGYHELLSHDLFDYINHVLLKGIESRIKNTDQQTYLFGPLNRHINDMLDGNTNNRRITLMLALSDRDSFRNVYETVLDHISSIEHSEDLYWILIFGLEEEDIARLAQEGIADRMCRYIVSLSNSDQYNDVIDALSPYVSGQTKTMVLDMPNIQEFRELTEKAAGQLKNRELEISELADAVQNAYFYLLGHEKLRELCADEIEQLYKAYFIRLCLETVKGNFIEFIEQTPIFMRACEELMMCVSDEPARQLVGWADRLLAMSKTESYFSRIEQNYISAIIQFRSQNRKAEMIAAARKLESLYVTFSFAKYKPENNSAKNNRRDPLYVYTFDFCSDNVFALLKMFHDEKKTADERNLLSDLLHAVHAADTGNFLHRNRSEFEIQKCRLARILEEIGYEKVLARSIQKDQENHWKNIEMVLNTPSRFSDFDRLAESIELLLEIDRQQLHWEDGLDHCHKLIHLITGTNDGNDSVVHEILANNAETVRIYEKYFESRTDGSKFNHEMYHAVFSKLNGGKTLFDSFLDGDNLEIGFRRQRYD